MWILFLVLYTFGGQTVSAPTMQELHQFNTEFDCKSQMKNHIVAGGEVIGDSSHPATISPIKAELHAGYLCVFKPK